VDPPIPIVSGPELVAAEVRAGIAYDSLGVGLVSRGKLADAMDQFREGHTAEDDLCLGLQQSRYCPGISEEPAGCHRAVPAGTGLTTRLYRSRNLVIVQEGARPYGFEISGASPSSRIHSWPPGPVR
jgi:hypothetical protein